jgi:hypothetical protein
MITRQSAFAELLQLIEAISKSCMITRKSAFAERGREQLRRSRAELCTTVLQMIVRNVTFVASAVATVLLPAGGCESGGERVGFGAAPPEEDVYAIRCLGVSGADHVEVARRCEQLLRQVRELRADLVKVVHDEAVSTVYYGRYRRDYDEASGRESFRPDYRRDLELVRRLSVAAGEGGGAARYQWPFLHATIEPLPYEGGGRPEWDLSRAEGYYSWQIAVFYNEGRMRERRTAAEQYVQQLREQGVEAYYHHGPTRSSVCVGLFPEAAIQRFDSTDPLTGRVTATNRIMDPRMLELERQFPHMLENGRVIHTIIRDPETGEIKEKRPNPSFAVRLPEKGAPGELRGD